MAASANATMTVEHISDHDLERYDLGMVTNENELASLEEHILWCADCIERAEQTLGYVDAMRVAGWAPAEGQKSLPALRVS